ncbi:extracellular fatty acid-binding protein-like [Podarcis lilfordi]|uniref:Extracellular fatty acid-binding protein-like n=1 Tax=Podarcis lilfordi TaxID=74358 RepID=A0AA35PRR0_9SAUR|nr:extracellular fatty acid-binding protein-like [Podarcis lilfordi]
MKLFLLAVPLAFFCLVQGFSDDPQHREKAKGRWMALALSTTDPKILEHMEKMKIVMVDVSFEETMWWWRPAFPHPMAANPSRWFSGEAKTGNTTTNAVQFGDHKVEVIETDGQTYAIVDLITSRDGQTYQTSTLYARDAESQPIGLLEDFQQRSENRGFASEQIKIFPKEVACQDEAE